MPRVARVLRLRLAVALPLAEVLGRNFGLLADVGDVARLVAELGLGVIEEACGVMGDHRTGHGRVRKIRSKIPTRSTEPMTSAYFDPMMAIGPSEPPEPPLPGPVVTVQHSMGPMDIV